MERPWLIASVGIVLRTFLNFHKFSSGTATATIIRIGHVFASYRDFVTDDFDHIIWSHNPRTGSIIFMVSSLILFFRYQCKTEGCGYSWPEFNHSNPVFRCALETRMVPENSLWHILLQITGELKNIPGHLSEPQDAGTERWSKFRSRCAITSSTLVHQALLGIHKIHSSTETWTWNMASDMVPTSDFVPQRQSTTLIKLRPLWNNGGIGHSSHRWFEAP